MNCSSSPLTPAPLAMQKLVGLDVVHWNTLKVYRIQALVWDGVADEWAVLHAEVLDNGSLHTVSIVRPLSNFTAEVFPGVPRYDLRLGGYGRAVAVLDAVKSSMKDSKP